MTYKEWNHEKAEKTNRPINSTEIESLINVCYKKNKSPEPEDFPSKFSQYSLFSVKSIIKIFLYYQCSRTLQKSNFNLISRVH